MSDSSRVNIASVTGTYRTLAADTARAPRSDGVSADSGKILPPSQASKPEDLMRFAEALNAEPTSIGRNLRFKVDLTRGTSVIQVLDRDTGEIIRQIPPEKISTYLRSEGGLALRLYDELA